MTLVRLVEVLLRKQLNKKENGRNTGGCHGLTLKEHEALVRLDTAHDKHDSDGTPLWYVPRSWIKTQKEISTMLRTMTETLNTIGGTQKAIVRTLDRMENESRQVSVPKR